MIKVLHILSDSNIGGAGTYAANLARSFDERRVSMSVLLPRDSKAIRLFEKTPADIISADITPDKSLDLRSVPLMRSIIRKSKCDIVHAHGSAAARLAAKGICKSVFTKHTLSSPGNIAARMVYRVMGGYAIAVSDAARENLVALGFNAKRIFTVYNGVADMGVPDADASAAAKRSFGIDASKTVVGCVARFSREKDYGTFLNAAAIACRSNDKLAFLLCGEGPELNESKTLAKRLGIYSKCVFAGNVYDTQRAYHAMDVYMGTSLEESFGQSVIEAWSACVPAVLSNARGFCEISRNADAAVICNSGDCQAFADAVTKLCSDSSLAHALGTNGRKRYAESYAADEFAAGITEVYEKVLGLKK